jgi:hypothetical protein
VTREQLKAKFPYATEAFLARNCDISGGLAGPERKPDPLPPLVKRPKVQRSGKSRLVVIVTIIAFRNRFLDDDNIGAGAKSLRDCVATSLGVDDGDKRIKWEYGFVQSAGREQTLVLMQLV